MIMLVNNLLAAPSPIADEDFLLFLAQSIEDDGQLLDPLTLIENESVIDAAHSNVIENQKTKNTQEAEHVNH